MKRLFLFVILCITSNLMTAQTKDAAEIQYTSPDHSTRVFRSLQSANLQKEKVYKLHLSMGNDISEFPEIIFSMPNLEELYLNFCKIKEIPEGISKLTNLKKLVLSNNELTRLPEDIGTLKNLNQLNVSGNKLSELPETIGDLSQLEGLDLSSNQLNNLPSSIGKLKQLKNLTIYGNQLTSFPKSIGNLIHLEGIHAERNRLTSIPSTIGQLSKLNSLRLSQNQLTTLPDEIGQLTNLSYLTLYSNQLKTLPNTFAQLTKIQHLDLQKNRLEYLPDAIVAMENLTTIKLAYNQIKELPSSLENLKNLKHLSLWFNQLISLPQSIEQLTNLQTLILRNNQLKELPEEITNLKSLTSLYIGGNLLTHFPQKIDDWSNLSTLELYDNPIAEDEQNRIKKLLPNCAIDIFPKKSKEEQTPELMEETPLSISSISKKSKNATPQPLTFKYHQTLPNNWNDTTFTDFRNQVLQHILNLELGKAIELFPDDKLYEKNKLKEKLTEFGENYDPSKYKYEQWSVGISRIQYALIKALPPQQNKVTPISPSQIYDLIDAKKIDKALQLAINSGYEENIIHQQALLNRAKREYLKETISESTLSITYARIRQALQYYWK